MENSTLLNVLRWYFASRIPGEACFEEIMREIEEIETKV